MRRVGRALLGSLVALALPCVSCSEGEVANIGLKEPFRINGQFVPGDLPGKLVPEPDGGAAEAGSGDDAGPGGDAGIAKVPLHVDFAFVPFIPVPSGAAGVSFNGQVSTDTAAVGVRFADMGTGYWVVPVGPIDITTGELNFSMSASFNVADPPGPHDLVFVALDGAGHGGAQLKETLCLDSRVPDGQHACIPTNSPPTAVFSLRWDADFDLDLHVRTPEGIDVNAKSRPDLVVNDAGGPPPPTSARIDRDSLAHCTPDGYRQEDILWPPTPGTGAPNPPTHGTYFVYVDPFASCGQPSVRFTFTLYTLSGTCPDCRLVPRPSVSGELIAAQATGGGSPPTFVTQYSL